MVTRTDVPLVKDSDVASLIKVNQKLKELGIEKTIKLPQICVIGDQSAGKSSLIEALSMIKVPREAGCCTQCPLAINLSAGDKPDSQWKCAMYIEEQYSFDFDNPERKPTAARPMGPWIEQEQAKVTLFEVIYDKDDICDLIRAAQQKVLNPGEDVEDNTTSRRDRRAGSGPQKFSPNVIRLDISEGNYPNLSFIDLPGIISNTENPNEQYLIELVKNLVRKYARNPEFINILTLPMTNDIANSNGLRLIQTIKSEGRTMAVLTKPDRVNDAKERQQFLDKFHKQFQNGGEQQQSSSKPQDRTRLMFEHGYHVVMMPSNMALSHGEARDIEAKFFTGKPWSAMGVDLKSRLGIENVRVFIRQLLFNKTRETLPQNLNSIEQRLLKIAQRLKFLLPPPKPSEVPFIIFDRLHKFEERMRTSFNKADSGARTSSLCTEFDDLCRDFRQKITNGRPRLLVRTSAETARLHAVTRKQERPSETIARAHQGDTVDLSSDDERVAFKNEDRTLSRGEKSNKCPYRFELLEVRDLNRKYNTSGLPRQSHPQALQDMMKLSTQGWSEISKQFMERVTTLFMDHAVQQLGFVFSSLQTYELYDKITKWSLRYLDGVLKDETRLVQDICKIEMVCPYTMDEDGLALKTEECLKARLELRDTTRREVFKAEYEAAHGSKQKKFNSGFQLPVDEFKTEVEMWAKARAYYEIASVRFTDTVCQCLIARLFPQCSIVFSDGLKSFLGIDDPSKHDQLVKWMSEDPDRKREREELGLEQKRLQEGKKYIEDVLSQSEEVVEHDDLPSRGRSETTADVTPATVTPATPTRNKRTRPATRSANREADDEDDDCQPIDPPSTTKRLRRAVDRVEL